MDRIQAEWTGKFDGRFRPRVEQLEARLTPGETLQTVFADPLGLADEFSFAGLGAGAFATLDAPPAVAPEPDAPAALPVFSEPADNVQLAAEVAPQYAPVVVAVSAFDWSVFGAFVGATGGVGGDLPAANPPPTYPPPTSPPPGGGTTTLPSWPKVYTALANMDSSNDLWWFGGEKPSEYATSIELHASPSNPSAYYGWRWEIVSGTDKVDFAGQPGQDVTTFSAPNNAITLVSTAASANLGDVKIEVRGGSPGGGFSPVVASATLSVPRPHHLVHLRDVDTVDATYAYLSFIHYRIEDQFNTVLPRDVEINEKWTGGVVADAPGMNWRRGDAGPAKVNPADWKDVVGGEASTFTPMPQNPQTPLGNTAVTHWNGEWRVGSKDIGKGLRVQTNTWQKYQDHARHTNVVSPA